MNSKISEYNNWYLVFNQYLTNENTNHFYHKCSLKEPATYVAITPLMPYGECRKCGEKISKRDITILKFLL